MAYKVSGGCRNHWLFCLTTELCDFLCIRQVEQNLSLILWRQMLAFCGFLYVLTAVDTHTYTHTRVCACMHTHTQYRQISWQNWNNLSCLPVSLMDEWENTIFSHSIASTAKTSKLPQLERTTFLCLLSIQGCYLEDRNWYLIADRIPTAAIFNLSHTQAGKIWPRFTAESLLQIHLLLDQPWGQQKSAFQWRK